jgi:serine phosphatase RsbU (regulator of sigma subunit)
MDGATDRLLASRILDAMPTLVVYLDRDLRIIECNPSAARAFRARRGDLLGRSMDELTGIGSRMSQAMHEVLETGKTVSGDFTYARHGVPDIVNSVTASLIPDIGEDGIVRGVFAIADDITPQVLALQSAVRFTDSLNIVLKTVVSAVDAEKMLDEVAAEALRVMGADYSLVVGRNAGRWVVSHHHGHGGRDRVGVDYTLEDRPVILNAVQSGEVQLVEDALTDPNTNKEIMRRFGIRSFAAVPLQYEGRPLGVFEIAYVRDRRTFDEPAVSFLRNLASAVSLALGRLEQFQHERRIADTLQGALLSLPEHVEGVDFASRYIASSDEALVGGDFYDVFEIDHGRVGVTIGDISGKGLDAASITKTARNALRLCALDGMMPGEAVTKTNEVLLRVTPAELFATLFFGVLDTVSGLLRYVTAAHPSAIVVAPDGRSRSLGGKNPIVGAFGGVRYGEESTVLMPGETLLLFTDGLTEARCAGELFGEDRVLECLATIRFDGPSELLDGVLGAARAFSDGVFRDDVAMLALALARG